MSKYTFLDHTGDEAVEVYGRSSKELFQNAAEAFFSIVTDGKSVRPAVNRKIELTAEEYEDLLVAWLDELLYLFETEQLLCCRFDIEELDGHRLRASVWGEPYEATRHTIRRVVKAVTYHQLSVSERAGQWEARVVFDL